MDGQQNIKNVLTVTRGHKGIYKYHISLDEFTDVVSNDSGFSLIPFW